MCQENAMRLPSVCHLSVLWKGGVGLVEQIKAGSVLATFVQTR